MISIGKAKETISERSIIDLSNYFEHFRKKKEAKNQTCNLKQKGRSIIRESLARNTHELSTLDFGRIKKFEKSYLHWTDQDLAMY